MGPGEIEEGLELVDRALTRRRPQPYQLQAAIAGLHARARTPAETDWAQIAALYAELLRQQPSPVVALNRAAAVAMAQGAERGLELVEEIDGLEGYHLYHSARADLLRRLGRTVDARAAYESALAVCGNAVDRAFIERRLTELADP